jgi:hypothetical protein
MRGSECGCEINPHPMREGASSGRRAGDRGARGAGRELRQEDASRRARADRAVHRAVDPLGDEARHADGIDVARGRPDAAIRAVVAPETGAVLAAGDGGEVDGHGVHARIGRNAAAEMVVDDHGPAGSTGAELGVDASEVVGRRDDAREPARDACRAARVAQRGGEARGRTAVDRRGAGIDRGRTCVHPRVRHRNASVDRRGRAGITAAAHEAFVGSAVAVVVEAVADLGRGTDRAHAGAEGTSGAGLGSVPADAEPTRARPVREARLSQRAACEHVVVDGAVAVVVDRVAGLGDRHEGGRRRNALDGGSTDALERAGRGAASASEGASTAGRRAAAAGRAREVAAVAVLIDHVAADLGRRTDLAGAGAPERRTALAVDTETGLRAGHADAATREGHRVARAGANDALVDHAVTVVVDAVAGLAGRIASRHVAGDHACGAGVEAVTSASADAFATRRRRGHDARIGAADHAGIADAVAVLVLEVAALLECRNDLADAGAEDASGADARTGSALADASRARATRVAALDVAVDRAVAVVVQVVADLGRRETGGRGADELHARAAVRAHAHAGADAGAARIVDPGIAAAGDAEEKTAVAVLVDLVVGDLGRGADGSDAVAPGHRSGIVVPRAVATDADAGVAGAEREARLRDVVVDHAVAVVVEAVGHATLGAASGFVGSGRADLGVGDVAHPDTAGGADAETGRTGHRSDDVGIGAAGRAHTAVAGNSGVVGHARVRDALAPVVARVAVLEAGTEVSVRGGAARVDRARRVALPHARGYARNGRRHGGGAGDLPADARDVGHEIAGLEGADGRTVGTETGLPRSPLSFRARGAGLDEGLDVAAGEGAASGEGDAGSHADQQDETVLERGRTNHGERTLSSVNLAESAHGGASNSVCDRAG